MSGYTLAVHLGQEFWVQQPWPKYLLPASTYDWVNHRSDWLVKLNKTGPVFTLSV